MNQSKTIKIITGAFILALLVFIGFKYIGVSNTPPDADDVLVASRPSPNITGQEIISELKLLNSLHLDDSIFRSDIFLSLRDFTLEVVPEPQGRNNPFGPFGSDSDTPPTSARSPQ